MDDIEASKLRIEDPAINSDAVEQANVDAILKDMKNNEYPNNDLEDLISEGSIDLQK